MNDDDKLEEEERKQELEKTWLDDDGGVVWEGGDDRGFPSVFVLEESLVRSGESSFERQIA